MNPIRYLGMSKHRRNGPPNSTYYNIPIEHCYEIFDAIGGGIIALIDSSNPINSVCIKNPFFEPVGVNMDELPMGNTIVMGIIEHVLNIQGDLVTITEVIDNSVVHVDRCDTIDDIIPTINRINRENKIDLILNENN